MRELTMIGFKTNKNIYIDKACIRYNLLLSDLIISYKTSCDYTQCDNCKYLRFMTWDDYYKTMTACDKEGNKINL